MKTHLGTLPAYQADLFLAKNPTARPGSKTNAGHRRIFTHERDGELTRLKDLFATEVGHPVDKVFAQKSIPVLSPGIKDMTPCVPCQASHNQEWAENPATIAEFSNILKKMVNQSGYTAPPVPETSGNGIVYVGGGKYWRGIAIGIRMLRESGCVLPIEVWYRGDLEPVNRWEVAECGDVRFIDTYAHAIEHGGARILGGWESKLWAISHTAFRKILYLDADAYCVADPTQLIDIHGDLPPFQFWEDRHSQNTRIKWPAVWPSASKTVPPVQGGQLLIDVHRFWREVCLVHWMNQHSDFYHKHMFGDQDTWRLCLEATGSASEYLCRNGWTYSNGCLTLPDDAGEPFIVHRINSKLFPKQWEQHGKTWDGVPDPERAGESRVIEHWKAIVREQRQIPFMEPPSEIRDVDVIIPFCAADSRYLAECLESINAQRNVKVTAHVIADGCEWPELPELNRITLHRYSSAGGLGPYKITNWIVRTGQSKSNWIALQDADDNSHPDRLWRQIQMMLDEDAEMISSAMENYVSPEVSDDRELKARMSWELIIKPGGVYEVVPKGRSVNSTRTMSRDFFIRLNGFANLFCTGDFEFDNRARFSGVKILDDQTILAVRRLHNGSLTCGPFKLGTSARTKDIEAVKETLRIMDENPSEETARSLGRLSEVDSETANQLSIAHDSATQD